MMERGQHSCKKQDTIQTRVAVYSLFSAGLRIWNEHSSDSSTLIIAPELSNSPQLRRRGKRRQVSCRSRASGRSTDERPTY